MILKHLVNTNTYDFYILKISYKLNTKESTKKVPLLLQKIMKKKKQLVLLD